MPKLVHPELSYQVRGVLLNVYNVLGPMLKEEYYRDAIVLGVEKRGLLVKLRKGSKFITKANVLACIMWIYGLIAARYYLN